MWQDPRQAQHRGSSYGGWDRKVSVSWSVFNSSGADQSLENHVHTVIESSDPVRHSWDPGVHTASMDTLVPALLELTAGQEMQTPLKSRPARGREG